MDGSVAENHRNNKLLAALPASTLADLDRDLRVTSLDYGSTIYEANAPIDEVYFPQTGVVSLTVITDGHRLETSVIGREGAVGLQRGFGERLSPTLAAAQKGGMFSVISGGPFAQAVRAHEPLREMIATCTERLWAEAEQIAACNALHGTRERLCFWLLRSSDRVASDLIELTQENLAQMLGARRTTVTSIAQSLQKDRLIEYRRGRIKILDRDNLERSACECYGILQRRRAQG